MNKTEPTLAAAANLNRSCFCLTLDETALSAALRHESGDPAFYGHLIASRPHLFSQSPVFLPKADGAAMHEIVLAIEAAAVLQGYREALHAWAPAIAEVDHGPLGAFMGYDFHLGDSDPKLIEINTNAGGAFLNAFLARAQIACCSEVQQPQPLLDKFEGAVFAMFQAEWRRQGRRDRLRRIAIVDDEPTEQYLYPEFVLAKRLFERHGIEAVVADARDLRYEGGALLEGGSPVDLVYNRLVDFAFEEPRHAALREAYKDGRVVATPNPHNHALFADKRNLTLLSDQLALRTWGLTGDQLTTLASLPRTVRVTSANAEALWSGRKQFFFKPSSGHGGKAVYRGDKITKGVWATILESDYVAQTFAAPSERTIEVEGARVQRKLDVRLYTYAGETIIAAARLYQGQTTNFRTPGGGFAPVFFV